MLTITLQIPRHTPLATLRDLADSIGCDLRLMPDGSYVARPRDVQTNCNVLKMARRKRQYRPATLPTEPELA